MLEEKKLKDEELDQVSGGEKWYESYPIQTGSKEQSSQTNNIDSAGAKSASAEKAIAFVKASVSSVAPSPLAPKSLTLTR